MCRRMSTWLSYIFLLHLISVVVSTEYVPVYMWETSKHTETIPALDRISQESFKDLLLERLAKNPFVVIFAERNLSPEDFAQRDTYGNTPFSNLLDLKSKTRVTYWPFVHSPLRAVKQLDKKTVEVSVPSLLDELNVPKDSVLIIDLNDAKADEDRSEMLKRHDEIIKGVYDKVSATHDNILALYTAQHASWVVPEEVRKHRVARSLLADNTAEADTRFLINSTYVLFYLNATGSYVNNSVSANLSEYSATSAYENSTSTATLILTAAGKPTISFYFLFNAGYWYLNTLNVTEDANTYSLNVKNIYAPVGFSYHCTSQVIYGKDSTSQNLTLPGFQVQAYVEQHSSSFGDAYDCVGFTSAPIWSGLFVTFILALIMTFGLTMMMDIKTMDRFDDPKGKTITVNVSE